MYFSNLVYALQPIGNFKSNLLKKRVKKNTNTILFRIRSCSDASHLNLVGKPLRKAELHMQSPLLEQLPLLPVSRKSKSTAKSLLRIVFCFLCSILFFKIVG